MSEGRRFDARVAALAAVHGRLESGGSSRLQVLLILVFCGLVGFGVSVGLLRLGVEHMGLRYAIAALSAYGAFFLCIRVWVHWRRRAGDLCLDVPSTDLDVDGVGVPRTGFGGGRSGGAGGGGHWHTASDVSHGVDVGVDLDDGWLLVLAVACLAGGLLAVGYVVYMAPVLLAEIALDAALVSGVYRRLRRSDTRHWFDSALRRTWVPALTMTMFAGGVGVVLEWMAPSANSIGDVWPRIQGFF